MLTDSYWIFCVNVIAVLLKAQLLMDEMEEMHLDNRPLQPHKVQNGMYSNRAVNPQTIIWPQYFPNLHREFH